MAVRTVVRGEQRLLQSGESVPILVKLPKFAVRDTAEHGSEDVPALRFFGGVYIPGNVQVVVIGADVVTADQL